VAGLGIRARGHVDEIGVAPWGVKTVAPKARNFFSSAEGDKYFFGAFWKEMAFFGKLL